MIKLLRTLNRIPVQFLLLSLLIFTFITYPGSNPSSEDPLIWYFSGYPILWSSGVIMVYFTLIVLFRGMHIVFDTVGKLLFVRVFLCLIPAIYSYDPSFFSHYPVVIFSLLAYLIALNGNFNNEKSYASIIFIFGFILIVQIILTFQRITTPYMDLTYKAHMRIPIAASNVIATYIVPIFFLFLFNAKTNALIKTVVALLFIVATMLTKSRGGVVCLVLTYVIYLIFIKYHLDPLHLLLIVCTMAFGIYLLLQVPEIKLFLMGFGADDTTFDANHLSSNRLGIFQQELQRGLKHPLFGNGMIFNEETSFSGSHNLLVELFVQSGLIGLCTYIAPIIIVIRTASRRIAQNKNILGWFLFIIATLLHGMVEVNFFNYSTDILFWFACGTIMSYDRKSKILLTV